MTEQFNTTVNLTPNQIKEAIATYLEKQLSVIIDRNLISIDVGMHHEDRGGMSYPVLEGATAKIKTAGTTS